MTQVTKAEQPPNPFLKNAPEHINAGTVEVESSRAIAEVQAKLIIAKKFMRDEASAMSEMLKSCQRTSFASQAMYSYPRGTTTIAGPSIRMAEELARTWGNIDFGTKELSRRKGESEMQAYAWDLQTNLMRTINFTVAHKRDTKGGGIILTDERDIYEVTANQAGRRVRACLLAILPPDFVDSAVQECRKTLAADANTGIIDRIKNMLDSFVKVDVTVKMIEDRLKKTTANITAEDLVDLAAIFTSIKDGAPVNDWFEAEPAKLEAPSLAKLEEKKEKVKKEPEPKAEEPKKEDPNSII